MVSGEHILQPTKTACPQASEAHTVTKMPLRTITLIILATKRDMCLCVSPLNKTFKIMNNV